MNENDQDKAHGYNYAVSSGLGKFELSVTSNGTLTGTGRHCHRCLNGKPANTVASLLEYELPYLS